MIEDILRNISKTYKDITTEVQPQPNKGIFRNAGVNVDGATLTILNRDGIIKQIMPNSKDRLLYY